MPTRWAAWRKALRSDSSNIARPLGRGSRNIGSAPGGRVRRKLSRSIITRTRSSTGTHRSLRGLPWGTCRLQRLSPKCLRQSGAKSAHSPIRIPVNRCSHRALLCRSLADFQCSSSRRSSSGDNGRGSRYCRRGMSAVVSKPATGGCGPSASRSNKVRSCSTCCARVLLSSGLPVRVR